MIAINKNGDIFPCDVTDFPEERLGNISKDRDLIALLEKSAREKPYFKEKKGAECGMCPWWHYCRGGCTVHMKCAAEEQDVDIIECTINRNLYPQLIALILQEPESMNKLLGYERVIVSDVAGTTRDAIDTPFIDAKGRKFTIIDTAGMRKKSSVDKGVEQYAVMRALAAVRRADVCLIVIDASEGISEQDVKICGYVDEQNKPSVILMNKWDLVEKDTNTVNVFNKQLDTELKFMDYKSVAYVSAKTGQRLEKALDMLEEAYEQSCRRVTTGVLNDVVRDAVLATEPPSYNGRRLKILYATQDGVCPPTFVFFVNDAKLLHFSYKRYLENRLRTAFGFKGTPIRLIYRSRAEKE